MHTFPTNVSNRVIDSIIGVMKQLPAGTLEMSASDRIWELILDTIQEMEEINE